MARPGTISAHAKRRAPRSTRLNLSEVKESRIMSHTSVTELSAPWSRPSDLRLSRTAVAQDRIQNELKIVEVNLAITVQIAAGIGLPGRHGRQELEIGQVDFAIAVDIRC